MLNQLRDAMLAEAMLKRALSKTRDGINPLMKSMVREPDEVDALLRPEVNVEVGGNKDYTYAKITDDRNEVAGLGFAKRNPGDKPDRVKGKKLAVTRALISYFENLEQIVKES